MGQAIVFCGLPFSRTQTTRDDRLRHHAVSVSRPLRYNRHNGSHVKGVIRIVSGVILVILGIIGLILPIMPGWVFLIPGLVILGDYFPPLKRLLRWARRKVEKGAPAGGGASARAGGDSPVQ